jgi:diguanylate cyclase (GGDEF)-like protein/PAS domain S-box-containing protein
LVRLLTLDGRVTYTSPSVERILGYSVEEYLAAPAMSLLHPSELELVKKMLSDVKSGKLDGGLATYRLRHKNGEYRWFEVRWEVIRDAHGNARELHTAGRDVTERREAEQRLNSYAKQLRSLSIRDELTGLYNRRGFIEAAGQLHEQALRSDKTAALIFVDINGMKRINDELGHEAGDDALMDAADVLTASLRDVDVVGRLGGDEFVAFALDFTSARLDALRSRVRELADARVRDRGRPYRLSMSVGAAFVDLANPSTLDELLERADVSMYEQKKSRQAAGGVSVPPPSRRA